MERASTRSAISPSGAPSARLIADYEALIAELCAGLAPGNRDLAVALAALPETIRGYGPIKMKAIAAADEERRRLLDLWRAPPERRQAAE